MLETESKRKQLDLPFNNRLYDNPGLEIARRRKDCGWERGWEAVYQNPSDCQQTGNGTSMKQRSRISYSTFVWRFFLWQKDVFQSSGFPALPVTLTALCFPAFSRYNPKVFQSAPGSCACAMFLADISMIDVATTSWRAIWWWSWTHLRLVFLHFWLRAKVSTGVFCEHKNRRCFKARSTGFDLGKSEQQHGYLHRFSAVSRF